MTEQDASNLLNATLSLHSARHLPHILMPPPRCLLCLWDLLEFDQLESLMPTFTEDNHLEMRDVRKC